MSKTKTKKKNDQVKLLLKLHELESDSNGFEKSKTFRRIEKGLDPGLLKRYQKLKQRKEKAVAVLEDGACSECNMLYPESHDVQRYRNFVHNCEYCGRILVVTDNS